MCVGSANIAGTRTASCRRVSMRAAGSRYAPPGLGMLGHLVGELVRGLLVDPLAPVEERELFALLGMLGDLLTFSRDVGSDDLDAVPEAMPSVKTGLAARPAGDLSHEFRSAVLATLGMTELWASRFYDARHHLELALALARRAERPWMQVEDLGHLAIATVSTGRSFAEALELSEEAVRIADAHGYRDPGLISGLAAGAMARLWLGRSNEAEEWLERAERSVRPGSRPTTELVVHHGRGLLRLAQGRFEEALAAFRAAEEMQALLVGTHAFAVSVRARLLQSLVLMGDLEAVEAEFSGLTAEERDTSELRIA